MHNSPGPGGHPPSLPFGPLRPITLAMKPAAPHRRLTRALLSFLTRLTASQAEHPWASKQVPIFSVQDNRTLLADVLLRGGGAQATLEAAHLASRTCWGWGGAVTPGGAASNTCRVSRLHDKVPQT